MYDFETAASQRRYQTMLRIEAGKKVLDQLNGKTRQVRQDGYVNLLSKYGTSQDNSTAYFFSPESIISDQELTDLYTGGGVFAKIIDAPAEEAVKKGFDTGITDQGAREYVEDTFAWLEWDENIATAMKWARLYGGAIAVLMVDDGRGLEEPLDMDAIKSIDEIRVYDRSIATPDFTSVYRLDPLAGKAGAGGRRTFLSPQFYDVSSINGSFRVHESRCLIFRNGKIPERSQLAQYRGWGIPEYIRIKKELREATTSTSYSVKMLEKCVQAIYSMKNLAELLATDDGEEVVLKRLRVIDMARSVLNSIAIDADGENYDFKSMTLSGVKDIVETTFSVLSSVSNIPQTILFGRSPAGENSTGLSDLENWYSYVGRNQRIMMRANMKYLLDIIIKAGMAQGYILEDPKPKFTFKPLWELSEEKQASVDQVKAATAKTKAETAQVYMDYQIISPEEVRRGLAKEGSFDIDTLLDDIPEDESWGLGENPDDPAAPVQPGQAAPGVPPQVPASAPSVPAAQNGDRADGQHHRRYDDGADEDWVTMNGTHVLLGEGGSVSGGPPNLQGKTFSSAKSQKKPKASGSSGGSSGGSSSGSGQEGESGGGTGRDPPSGESEEPWTPQGGPEDVKRRFIENATVKKDGQSYTLQEVLDSGDPELMRDMASRLGAKESEVKAAFREGNIEQYLRDNASALQEKELKKQERELKALKKGVSPDMDEVVGTHVSRGEDGKPTFENYTRRQFDEECAKIYGERTLGAEEYYSMMKQSAADTTADEYSLQRTWVETGFYHGINDKMRSGSGEMSQDERDFVSYVQTKAKPVSRDVDLYRVCGRDYAEQLAGCSMSDPQFFEALGRQIGTTFPNEGITATAPGIAQSMSRMDTHIRYTVRQGSKVYVTQNHREGEIFLPPGTKTRLTGVHQSANLPEWNSGKFRYSGSGFLKSSDRPYRLVLDMEVVVDE